MQAVDSLTAEAVLPPIEQRPGDTRFRAGGGYSDLRRTPYDLQPHPLYALVEGHRSSCPKVVSLVGSTLRQIGQMALIPYRLKCQH